MNKQLESKLYWPPKSNKDFWAWILLLGCLAGFTIILFFPLAMFLFWKADQENKIVLDARQKTMDSTSSILMSRVNYVGGHPLLPDAGTVVLGLSKTAITIYLIDEQHAIMPKTKIPLKNIVQLGTGRPKSAREVYDEDYGYSIDVYEKSPFFSLVFRLKGDAYRASFDSFDSDSPKQWYNKVTSFQYELKQSNNAPNPASS